jgi:hypothetical protein
MAKGPKFADESWSSRKKAKFLDWLPAGNFERHLEIRKDRMDNCGEWFLSCDEFQMWLAGGSKKLLICSGKRLTPL